MGAQMSTDVDEGQDSSSSSSSDYKARKKHHKKKESHDKRLAKRRALYVGKKADRRAAAVLVGGTGIGVKKGYEAARDTIKAGDLNSYYEKWFFDAGASLENARENLHSFSLLESNDSGKVKNDSNALFKSKRFLSGLMDEVPPIEPSKRVTKLFNATVDQLSTQEKQAEGRSGRRFHFDFVKFDLFRDFTQILGLFLNAIYFPVEFSRFWKFLYGLVSFDWAFELPNVGLMASFYIINVLVLFILFLFYKSRLKKDNEEVRGHEYKEWGEVSRVKRLLSQINLTGLTTLYLPATRNSIDMIICDGTRYYPDCGFEEHRYTGIIFSAPVLLLVSLYLPYKIYSLVQSNRPNPSAHDDEGNRAAVYTAEDYKDDLAGDESPYKFLYDGYEYKWAFYKSIVMGIKAVLIAIVASYQFAETAAVIAALCVLSLFAALSFYSAPFIKDEDDRIDQSARVTTVLTVLAGTIAWVAFGEDTQEDSTIGYTLTGINALNLVIMITLAVWSFGPVKRRWKLMTGRVDYDPKFRWADNLLRQKKRRIWHKFWESLFYTQKKFAPAAGRLVELKSIAANIGIAAYRDAVQPLTQRDRQRRRFVETQLEGLDAYWNPEAKDMELPPLPKRCLCIPKLKSPFTHFGKLYITAFPWQCVIVFDGSGQAVKVPPWLFAKFVRQNQSDEITRRRTVRLMLRALNGKLVNLGSFGVGKLIVTADEDRTWTQGFKVTAELGLPGTDPTIVTAKQLGIKEDFSPNPSLDYILQSNQQLMMSSDYADTLLAYRRGLRHNRNRETAALRNEFWYIVFNNPNITRRNLELYIRNYEIGEAVATIPLDHRKELDMVYQRLAYFDSHPAVAGWFVFWDDLWEQNGILKKFKDNEDILNPILPESIAMTPMDLPSLLELLKTRGLKGLVPNKVLQALYTRLNNLTLEWASRDAPVLSDSDSDSSRGSSDSESDEDATMTMTDTGDGSDSESDFTATDDESSSDDDSSSSSDGKQGRYGCSIAYSIIG